jgi:hypothetical protein
MPTPGEHKTVQTRILGYAESIGWTFVSREAAEQRRGFDPVVPPADRAKNRALFFDDLLDAKVREYNACYAEAEGALLGLFRHLHTDISVTARKDDVSAADQAAMSNVAGWCSISVGGGLIQTTSG